MAVMIGIDPHKGSHTAVAVDITETALAQIRVRTGPAQLERLLDWGPGVPGAVLGGRERHWARLPHRPAARRGR